MDAGVNGRKLYTGLKLDYRFRLWGPTSAAVTELLVFRMLTVMKSDKSRSIHAGDHTTNYHS